MSGQSSLKSLSASPPPTTPVVKGHSPSTEVDEKQLSLSVVSGGTAGFFSSTVNMLKSIIGSGMLALPFAVQSVGVIPGLVLLSTAAILSAFGLQLLILASDELIRRGLATPRSSNFASLAKPTYPRLAVVFDLAVFFKCLLVATSYLTVVVDMIMGLMAAYFPDNTTIFTQRFFWVSAMALFIAPVSFMPRMDSLKYTSFLGLIGIVYLFCLSIWMFFTYNASLSETFGHLQMFVPFTFRSLKSFSVFVFALTCHQNIFPIYNELKDNRPSRLLHLITICISSAFSIYAIFSLSFIGVFGDDLMPNVIRGFSTQGAQYQIARFLYAALMIFSYPLQTFPARASLLKVITPENGFAPRISYLMYALVTSGILLITWLLTSLNVPLDDLMALVGCTTGPVICYFLPGLFWWKLQEGKPFNRSKSICVMLFVFGALATVIPLIAFIMAKVGTQ